MDEKQVAILQAAVIGGVLAEVAQDEDPDCDIDVLDCAVQAGHEALYLLQENPEALDQLNVATAPLLALFAVGDGVVGPLGAEVLA